MHISLKKHKPMNVHSITLKLCLLESFPMMDGQKSSEAISVVSMASRNTYYLHLFFCHYLVVASVVLSLVIALCHMDLSTHSLHICSSCFRVIFGTHIFIYWRSWFSVPTSTHLGVCMSCAKHCEFLRNKRPSIFQMLIFRYIWYVAICCSTLNHCDFCSESKESWAEVKFQALGKIMGSITHLTISSQHFPPML